MPEVSVEPPQEVKAGDLVKVVWQGPANPSDYLSIAEPESESNQYVVYKYVKKGKTTEMQMPEEPGEYRLRYISGVSSALWFEVPLTVAPRNETIEAQAEVATGESFSISWLERGFPQQYIGIFPAGSADDEGYATYTYTNRKTKAKLKAPDTPGEYELRYISGGKKIVWARKALKVVASGG
jgi:Ca-activated chloride channel family protein